MAHELNASRPIPPTGGLSANHVSVPVLSRRDLRKACDAIFAIVSELDAFIADFYPHIYREITPGMDRSSRVTLLLNRVTETELSYRLRQEYPSEFNEIQASISHKEESEHDNRVQYTIVLLATFNDIDLPKLKALISHLRKYTNDAELTIEEVRQGSVILVCEGSEDKLRVLADDFSKRKLTSLLGFQILSITGSPIKQAAVADIIQPQTLEASTGEQYSKPSVTDSPELNQPSAGRRRALRVKRILTVAFLSAAMVLSIIGLVNSLHSENAKELDRGVTHSAQHYSSKAASSPRLHVRSKINLNSNRYTIDGSTAQTDSIIRICMDEILKSMSLPEGTTIRMERIGSSLEVAVAPVTGLHLALRRCLSQHLIGVKSSELPNSITIRMNDAIRPPIVSSPPIPTYED